jgi:hypothetical protein
MFGSTQVDAANPQRPDGAGDHYFPDRFESGGFPTGYG